MEKTMRPLLLLLPLLLSLLRPSAALCLPRAAPLFLLPDVITASSSDAYVEVSSDLTATANPAITSTLSFGPHIATGAGLAIKDSCDRTSYPDLCISAVKPLLGANAGFSLGGATNVGLPIVLELMVRSAKDQTLLAMAQFAKGAEDPSTSPVTAKILKGCVSKYRDAAHDFDTVLHAISKNDIFTAQTFLSGALTYYSTCSGGDAPGDPTLDPNSSWVVNSKSLISLVDNCLDLCAILK